MAEQPINLNLPSELYERIQRVADQMERPVEQVLVESLGLLFGETAQIDTDALHAYTDQQLWAVVHQRLTPPAEQRFRELMAKNKETTLPADEEEELDQLLNEANRQMLLRSEALVLLKKRGHDIDSYLRAWAA